MKLVAFLILVLDFRGSMCGIELPDPGVGRPEFQVSSVDKEDALLDELVDKIAKLPDL